MKRIYFLLFIIFFKTTVFGAVSITAPTLSINSCSYPSIYSNLGNIVITEGAVDDLKMPVLSTYYSIILTAPVNFEFLAGTGSVAILATGDITAGTTIVVTSTTITISYRSSQSNRINGSDRVTISGIQVRATAASTSVNILRTTASPGTATVTGITNGTTNFGSLSSAIISCCDHTIRLTDTYGDGWNGGTVSVSVNGVNVLTDITLAGGSGPLDFTFSAVSSDVIRVYETAPGSYDYEMRVELFDGGMTSIIAQQDPATGTATTGGSTASANCPPPMVISASTVTQSSTTSISNCSSNVQIIRLEITTTGATSPRTLTQIQTRFSGTAAIAGITSERVYYTGSTPVFSTTSLFGTGVPSTTTHNINGSQNLVNGVNYFWLVYDVNSTALASTTIDGIISQFTATAINYNTGSTPAISIIDPAGSRTLTLCLAPGGVATGLSHWIRSDIGVTGNPVTSWSDNSSVQILGDLVTLGAGQSPTVQSGIINYQNHIRFDGINDGLKSTNAVTAVTSGLYSNQNNTIIMVKNIRAVGIDVDYKWEIDGGGTNRMGFELNGNAQRFDFANGFSGQNNISTTNITNNNNIVGATTDATNSVIRINGLADVTHNHSGSSLAGTGATARNLYIGSNDVDNYAYYCNVDIAEEMTFNKTLNATELLQVESYLGVKYSITLGNQTIPSNYTSSNSTVIWTGLSAYQTNIIGLGRDDLSGLNTKQSKQNDDSVRIYLSTLQTTNAANTATFSTDRSFVLQGSNTGKLKSNATSMAEIPTGLTSCAIASRLEREWRVTRTNMNQNYNMDVRLSSTAAPLSVDVSHLRLLVDTDGDFSNGGTTCFYNGDGTGLVFTYNIVASTITISNISVTHIPNNATRFITIASINLATPLPIELINFDAKLNSKETVDLTWETSSERDNDYFTIEKSTDALNWEYLGTVKGAGSSSSPISYYLEDKNPWIGINYYRLKQTDFNGINSEVGVRKVNLYSDETFILSPNPAKNNVSILGSKLKDYSVELYNSLGQIIQCEILNQTSNLIELEISDLPAGVYYISLTNSNKKEILKLLINN